MVRRPRREPQRGTYALVFRLARASDVCVGRLGRYSLRPAFYVYVGSAFGPGGLAARLEHHLGSLARPHWHVDYLRQAADLEEIWLADGSVRSPSDASAHRTAAARATFSSFRGGRRSARSSVAYGIGFRTMRACDLSV
jgi:Uri superfamily endonuclease